MEQILKNHILEETISCPTCTQNFLFGLPNLLENMIWLVLFNGAQWFISRIQDCIIAKKTKNSQLILLNCK